MVVNFAAGKIIRVTEARYARPAIEAARRNETTRKPPPTLRNAKENRERSWDVWLDVDSTTTGTRDVTASRRFGDFALLERAGR